MTLWVGAPQGKLDLPAKFGGHGHCGSGDIMVLVCHEISRDHVIKESSDFIGGSPSW